jgi:hypothetical protein
MIVFFLGEETDPIEPETGRQFQPDELSVKKLFHNKSSLRK